MFYSSLFIATKTLKQLRCPSVGNEQTNCGTSTVAYDPAMKTNELLVHATICMTCQGVMQSEKSQSQKITYSMILFI